MSGMRCKFVVAEKLERHDHRAEKGNSFDLTLRAITGYNSGESDENKSYWKWTPSGELKLNTINFDAAKEFNVGDYVYLDISKAPE